MHSQAVYLLITFSCIWYQYLSYRNRQICQNHSLLQNNHMGVWYLWDPCRDFVQLKADVCRDGGLHLLARNGLIQPLVKAAVLPICSGFRRAKRCISQFTTLLCMLHVFCAGHLIHLSPKIPPFQRRASVSIHWAVCHLRELNCQPLLPIHPGAVAPELSSTWIYPCRDALPTAWLLRGPGPTTPTSYQAYVLQVCWSYPFFTH